MATAPRVVSATGVLRATARVVTTASFKAIDAPAMGMKPKSYSPAWFEARVVLSKPMLENCKLHFVLADLMTNLPSLSVNTLLGVPWSATVTPTRGSLVAASITVPLSTHCACATLLPATLTTKAEAASKSSFLMGGKCLFGRCVKDYACKVSD